MKANPDSSEQRCFHNSSLLRVPSFGNVVVIWSSVVVVFERNSNIRRFLSVVVIFHHYFPMLFAPYLHEHERSLLEPPPLPSSGGATSALPPFIHADELRDRVVSRRPRRHSTPHIQDSRQPLSRLGRIAARRPQRPKAAGFPRRPASGAVVGDEAADGAPGGP